MFSFSFGDLGFTVEEEEAIFGSQLFKQREGKEEKKKKKKIQVWKFLM